MANSIYQLGRQAFLEGKIAWLTDNIKLVLVSSAYGVNLSTDQFLSIIPGGAIIATSGNFTSVTSTNGIANAAGVTCSAVPGGSTVSYVVIYKDTGVSTTSPLILYMDTATNLPVTTNGGDIAIQWDTGTNKIFTLFEGLAEQDAGLVQWLRDWLRGLFFPSAVQTPSGLWVPAPKIIL